MIATIRTRWYLAACSQAPYPSHRVLFSSRHARWDGAQKTRLRIERLSSMASAKLRTRWTWSSSCAKVVHWTRFYASCFLKMNAISSDFNAGKVYSNFQARDRKRVATKIRCRTRSSCAGPRQEIWQKILSRLNLNNSYSAVFSKETCMRYLRQASLTTVYHWQIIGRPTKVKTKAFRYRCVVFRGSKGHNKELNHRVSVLSIAWFTN